MKKIDLHAHYISPAYNDYLNRFFDGRGDGVVTPKWSVEQQLSLMQANEIEYAILSISSPHLSAGDQETTISLATSVNDFAADLHAKHSDKLGFFASLPLPYVDQTIAAIKLAVGEQDAAGFTLPTNVQGTYIGDASFDPVMAELNNQHALVTLHPNEPKPLTSAATEIKTPLMEFFFDTTRAVVNMAQFHIFSRFPNITWLIPHAGALLPIVAQRISIGSKFLNKPGDPVPDDLMTVMKTSYFDMAGMVLPYQLPTLLKMADHTKLVYGSDFPYTPVKSIEMLSQQLEQSEQISDSLKRAIFFDNANKLMNENRH